MPWRAEAQAVLALTAAARQALARGDLETLDSLLAERGDRVRTLAGLLPVGDVPPGLGTTLDSIAASEGQLSTELHAGLGAVRAALGRPAGTPETPHIPGGAGFDRLA